MTNNLTAARTQQNHSHRRVFGSAGWTTAGLCLSQVIRLLTNLILTRYLLPEHFGTVVIANAVVIGLALLSDIGTDVLVIQHAAGEEPRVYNTMWTANVVRGLVLWGGSAVLAFPVSQLYSTPVLAWLLPALGAGVMVSGFNSTSLTVLTRRLAPGRVVVLNLVGTTTSAVGTIAWVAFIEADVWGFAVGNLVCSVVIMVGSHFVLPGHRNRFCWDKSAITSLIRLGRWVLLGTALIFFTDQVDRLFIGGVCGLSDLGVYQLAGQLCAAGVQLVATVGSAVLFPLFSEWVRSGRDARRQIQRTRRAILALGLSFSVGLLLLGPTLVRALYGPGYWSAGWMVQILAVGMIFTVAGVTGANYLKAVGRMRALAVTNVAKVATMVVLLPAGYTAAGLRGVLVGLVAAEAVRYLCIGYALRHQGFRILRDDVPVIVVVLAITAWITI